MKPLAVLIPKGLSIEGLVNTHSTSLETDYLKHLISHVLRKLAFHIENKEDEATSILKRYIPLTNSKCHARHDKYKRHIEFLIGDNVEYRKSRTRKGLTCIFYGKGYVKGKTPFSYKLSHPFNRKPLTVEYITDTKLIKDIKKTETKLPTIVKSGRYKFLGKYFKVDSLRPLSLQIDLDLAVQLCNERYKSHRNYGKYLNELNQLVDLYNGIYRVYHDKDTDGRIHSNITRLPKVYRKYLNYEGQPLVEVDLSNSIIYFLANILVKAIDESVINRYPLLLMIYKSLENLSSIEIEEFHKLAVKGEFYDCFIPEFEKVYSDLEYKRYYEKENNDTYTGIYKQKKKVVKKQLLAMLFANIDQYLVEQDVFKNKFPELLTCINAFKQEHGYNKLSHVLFQLEAYYLIDEVARGFNRKYHRKAPIFTLHDCLITTLDNKAELENFMTQSLTKLLGSAPMMKDKNW